MDKLFSGVRIDFAWQEIVNLVRNPYSNLTAALLLLSAVVVFVLLVAMTLIAIVTRPSRRREAYDEDELRYLLEVLQSTDDEVSGDLVEGWEPSARASAGATPTAKGLAWSTWLAVTVAALFVIGVAVGWTTTASAVCTAGQQSTAHSETVDAGGTDPHRGVPCVRCHESSGLLGLVTIEVPGRFAHMVAGASTESSSTPYGTVVSASCCRCHRATLRKTVEDADRGIRMSHRAPPTAGAECRDCHTLATGVVSKVTVGMSPCLRCHNGQAESAKCSVCHFKDVGAAARSRRNPAEMKGRILVPTPDCGGCHDQAKQCDPCHGGVRMPHSDLFMWWGHARQGVEDI